MGIFSTAFGRKDDNQEKDYFSASIFSSRPTPLVTEERALQVPSVKAAVELISNSISTLPIYLYEEVEENNIQKVQDDDRISRLNHDPNKFNTAQEIKKLIVKDYLLYGRSFLYKAPNGELHYLEAKNIKEEKFTEDGFTLAHRQFRYDATESVVLQEEELVVIDSGTYGVLTDGGRIINQALSHIDYSSSLLENGAIPVGVLKAASRLTQNAIDRLRNSFEGLYGGAKKAGRTLILEEGLEYHPVSLKPDEMELTESNKAVISEIARLFNIPESLINSNANKYNSLEANNLQFLQHTLSPIITQIESSLDKYLLDNVEKKIGLYFRFDTSEIIRTTEKEKIETISKGLQEGLFSFNEARAKLDLPREEDDFYSLSMGRVLKHKDGRMVYLNLGQENSAEVNSSNE